MSHVRSATNHCRAHRFPSKSPKSDPKSPKIFLMQACNSLSFSTTRFGSPIFSAKQHFLLPYPNTLCITYFCTKSAFCRRRADRCGESQPGVAGVGGVKVTVLLSRQAHRRRLARRLPSRKLACFSESHLANVYHSDTSISSIAFAVIKPGFTW